MLDQEEAGTSLSNQKLAMSTRDISTKGNRQFAVILNTVLLQYPH